jgi:hypothetical protein
VPCARASPADLPAAAVGRAVPAAAGTLASGGLRPATSPKPTLSGRRHCRCRDDVAGGGPGLTVWPVDAVEDLAGRARHGRGVATLGAGHLLEGAVRRSAERLQSRRALIDVASGRTRRSGEIRSVAGRRAALQDAIAELGRGLAPAWLDGRPDLHSYRPRRRRRISCSFRRAAHLKPFSRLPLMKALALVRNRRWRSIPTMPWPMPGSRRPIC